MRDDPRFRRNRGFSLLEVLVTVTIFALLFSVLMSGWYQAMRAQSQLDVAAKRLQRQQQLSQVFRRMVAEGLNPPFNGGLKFRGDASGFDTESSASLTPRVGAAPTPTELRILAKGALKQLSIRPAAEAATVYPWLFLRASLAYYDHAGNRYETWPPPLRQDPMANITGALQLPALVQLSIQFEGDERQQTLLAAPRPSTWNMPEPTPPIISLGGN